MDKYRLTAPVTFQPPARLHLTKEQVEPRTASLRKAGKAWEVIAPVTFKAGEELGHEGDLPKALAEHMTPKGGSRKDTGPDSGDSAPDTGADADEAGEAP